MGIYITFKVGPDQWQEKLDLNEDHALAIEAEKAPEVKAAYEAIFGDNVDGITRHVPCGVIRHAIDTLEGVAKAGLSSFTYSVVIPPGFVNSGVCSGAGGLRVGDTVISILCSVDHCQMTTYKQNDQGEWIQISEVDARDLGSIKTDNKGTVKIRKRAVPGNVLRFLRGTRKRLAAVGEDAMVDITVG